MHTEAVRINSAINAVQNMNLRDTRALFATLRRNANAGPSTLLPRFGLTIGEFSVAHVLLHSRTTRKRKNTV